MYMPGRRKTGYLKKKIWSFSLWFFGSDCYFIKYPIGSEVDEHTDPVKGKRHYRLNIILTKPVLGGVFIKNGRQRKSRIQFFRPDKDNHQVTRVMLGERKVLSFGFAI